MPAERPRPAVDVDTAFSAFAEFAEPGAGAPAPGAATVADFIEQVLLGVWRAEAQSPGRRVERIALFEIRIEYPTPPKEALDGP